jgi:hypothetical protein
VSGLVPILLALPLALALLAPPGLALAADPSPEGATTAGAAAKPPTPTEQEKDDTWIDFGHSFLEDRLFAPVFRVDRFFSDERDLESERSRSFIRWRNQLRFEEYSSRPSYTTDVAASLRFPGLNKQLARLQIEVLGQTRDTYSSLFPRSNPGPGEIPPPDQGVGTADAGLALRLWDTLSTHADVGAGLILALPPGEYVRFRLRFAQRPGLGVVTRQAVTEFWRTDLGFGTTESADVERPLAPWAVARLSATTTISQSSHRFDWQGDASVAAALRSRVGAVVGWGIVGATRVAPAVRTHRFYVRFRRDFYRRWIFFEVEPEYAWPYTTQYGRHGVAAIMFRVEFQFQGNEGKLFPGGVSPAAQGSTSGAPPPAAPPAAPPAPAVQPPPQAPNDPEPKDPDPQGAGTTR